MGLSVLHVAYPFAPVGARAVGGAEQILGEIDRRLVRSGHRSAVVACAGSAAAGEVFGVPVPPGQLDAVEDAACPADGNGEVAGAWRRHRFAVEFQGAIDRALLSRRVDLVHLHGLDWYRWRLPEGVPVLVTLHMPVAWYPAAMWELWRGRVVFQCVSRDQLAGCPDREARVIENGVAMPAFDPELGSGERRGGYALALGRICPEKNLHEALEAGTRAGVPVWVGGQVFRYAAHEAYDREWFRPALQRDAGGIEHRFLGALAARRKQRLLAGARCLLHPTLAPETSSLVAMEALAAGTPVVAYRSGALPEVVEEGVTGFLVSDVEEMVAAMGRVGEIRPEACRAAAARRFDRERMTAEYLGLYAEMVGHAQMVGRGATADPVEVGDDGGRAEFMREGVGRRYA